MDSKQLIVDLLADLTTPFCLLIIWIILDFIGKRYNNYIEEKKTNSPEFSEKYDKTKNKIQKTTITTFEIIYRILSYICLMFVTLLSIWSIASWIIGIIEHEEIEVYIAEIIIWLIIWICWYLFIKWDKQHEFEYESSDVKKEKIKKMIDNMFEEDTEESEESEKQEKILKKIISKNSI